MVPHLDWFPPKPFRATIVIVIAAKFRSVATLRCTVICVADVQPQRHE